VLYVRLAAATWPAWRRRAPLLLLRALLLASLHAAAGGSAVESDEEGVTLRAARLLCMLLGKPDLGGRGRLHATLRRRLREHARMKFAQLAHRFPAGAPWLRQR
jgi:hypothetical protein